MKTIVFCILFLSFIFVQNSYSKVVQILHTNDTHSYLDHTTHNKNMGGMARLKTKINLLKQEALKNSIQTIVVDGGDFLEGNVFYLAENGKKTLQIINEVGYDAIALGNHDYLMGPAKLDKLLGQTEVDFSLLAANVVINKKYDFLKKSIKPFQEFTIEGVKIALLGLTTNDITYRWSLEDCQITNPIDVAQTYEDILRNRGNDIVIALTHLGLDIDRKLARKSSKIDLIIGGHSHTALFQPEFEKNINGKAIPIFQAGMHTKYVGRLLLDINKNQKPRIIKYELIPLIDIEEDQRVASLVDEAKFDLEIKLGDDLFNKIIGVSPINESDDQGMIKWGQFIAETMKDSTKADIAIHAPTMNSENYPIGEFTRFDLYNSIPRIFDPSDTSGWLIYTTSIKGVWLKTLLKIESKLPVPLVYAGFSRSPEGKLLVNGKAIHPLKTYKVAFIEGVVTGAKKTSYKTLYILKNPIATPNKLWKALEDKIKELGKI